jgi:hypothetical protein
MSVFYHFWLCHSVYTADVLLLSLRLCQVAFGLSVFVNVKEIISPVVYNKQLFHNSVTAIFFLKIYSVIKI